MLVEIKMFSDIIKLNLVVDDKKCLIVNGKEKNVNVDSFVFRLKKIVEEWDEFMIDDSIMDGLSYSVSISENGSKKTYEGRNKFPNNFFSFISLMDGVR